MQIVIDIPNPPSEQSIINVPIHFCGGQVVDAGGYGFEERKTGKWEIRRSKTSGVLFYHCSCCEWCNTNWVKYHYCPNCGARMEGAEE